MDASAVETILIEALPSIENVVGLSVLASDGELLFKNAYGDWAERTDVQVPIASATKWFSGALVMTYVDDGSVALDTTLGEHFPQLPSDKAAITLRQCVSHTSGMWRTLVPSPPPKSLAEVPDRLASAPFHAQPGEALLYPDMGMQLAGALVEKIGRRPWQDAFADRIARPCGLARAEYRLLGGLPDVGSSIATTLDDATTFVAMLQAGGIAPNGSRILSKAAVETMETDQTAGARLERHPYQRYAPFDPGLAAARYGVGCWLEDIDPVTGRAGLAHSGGAFGTVPFIDLRARHAGVLLALSRRRQIATFTGNDLTTNSSEPNLKPAIAVYLDVRRELRRQFGSDSRTT